MNDDDSACQIPLPIFRIKLYSY